MGFKSTLAGGAARLNGSAYYYDYADYQAFLFVGVGGNSVNLDAETYGAEIELQASPTDRLDLILSASYVDATTIISHSEMAHRWSRGCNAHLHA